jgi:hypothetical protein
MHMNIAENSRVVDLVSDIVTSADRLQRDLGQVETKTTLYQEIREIRRSLNQLDGELRTGPVNTTGDAC